MPRALPAGVRLISQRVGPQETVPEPGVVDVDGDLSRSEVERDRADTAPGVEVGDRVRDAVDVQIVDGVVGGDIQRV